MISVLRVTLVVRVIRAIRERPSGDSFSRALEMKYFEDNGVHQSANGGISTAQMEKLFALGGLM